MSTRGALLVSVPLLPLLAAGVVAVGGRRLGERAGQVATGLVTVAFAAAALLLVTVILDGPVTAIAGTVEVGDYRSTVGLVGDALSAVLLTLVTGVGAIVHRYATTYLQGDAGFTRFFTMLPLTVGLAAVVVSAASLPLLFAAWVLIGPALAVLLSHERRLQAAREGAARTLRTYLLGDLCFLVGVLVAFSVFGDLDLRSMAASAPELADQQVSLLGFVGVGSPSVGALTLITLLLAVGAFARSAQLPLHGWLPDTMTAPTPVSALLHAGLVNVAGFLFVRLDTMVATSTVALHVLFVVGACTAVFGTVVMLTRPDIKGMLAHSTIGQMGFMVMQVGLGAFAAAIFHVVAHGIFKAALFLGSGSVITQRKRDRDAPAPLRDARGLPGPVRAVVALVLAVVIVGGFAWLFGFLPDEKPGSLVLLVFAAATLTAAAWGALRPQRAVAGPYLGLGLAAAVALVVLYLWGETRLDAFLDPAEPVRTYLGGTAVGPVFLALLALLVVGATLAVRAGRRGSVPGLYVWALRRGYVDHLRRRVRRRPVPAAASSARPITESDRARLRVHVGQAADLVSPLWPIENFIACNPLNGLEARPFEDAASMGSRLRGGRWHLPLAEYRRLHGEGRITDPALDLALARHGGDEAGATVDLAGRAVPVREIRRLAMLSADSVEPSPDTAVHADRVGVDRTTGDWLDAAFGTRVVADVDVEVGQFTAAFLDEGQAAWTMPGRSLGFYATWRRLLRHDRGIRLLAGGAAEGLADLPERPEDALLGALARLGIPEERHEGYLARSLAQLPGWAGFLKWRARAEHHPAHHEAPADLVEYLAVRVTYEAVLAEAVSATRLGVDASLASLTAHLPSPETHAQDGSAPSPALVGQVGAALGVDAHALADASQPAVATLRAELAAFGPDEQALVWQDAYETSYRTALVDQLEVSYRRPARGGRPAAQAVFCIDVRSEPFRRHLEAAADVETLGFAGFFAIPVRYQPLGAQGATDQCPVLIRPRNDVTDVPAPGCADQAERHVGGLRQIDAAAHLLHDVKEAVPTPYAYVEATGWTYAPTMVWRTVGPRSWAQLRRGLTRSVAPPVDTAPAIHEGFTAEQRAFTAETVLTLMSLTTGHARLVLLSGHGSTTENNPYESSLDCGACGGNQGAINARVAVGLLNDPEVRSALRDRGIDIPDDTWFVAGQHDTATDEVTLLDLHLVPESHGDDVEALRAALETARTETARERCTRLPGAPAAARRDGSAAREHVRARSSDWAQVRPEWGLAGNAAFIIGPRRLTDSLDLAGRTFLHTYDPHADPDGAVLEVILTAPLVVAEWINTQYYFSAVDNDAYGAGTKTVHNVVGRIGVLLGHRGDLQVGLPWQSVAADDTGLFHEPLRLLAVVAAPAARISAIIDRNPVLQQLFGNGWVAVVAREPDTGEWRQLGRDLTWSAWRGAACASSPPSPPHGAEPRVPA